MVKDLVQGSSWFFLGQCWLAVDEGDGRVERSLAASECGLTFKQVKPHVVIDVHLVKYGYIDLFVSVQCSYKRIIYSPSCHTKPV